MTDVCHARKSGRHKYGPKQRRDVRICIDCGTPLIYGADSYERCIHWKVWFAVALFWLLAAIVYQFWL